MDTKRVIIRAALLIVIVISVSAIIIPLILFGYNKVEVWNTSAASLAVITAVLSTWMAQNLFEKQEDAQQPCPYLTIDPHSRIGLLLLRVINIGGSTAYDINFKWNQPLLNVEGSEVRFSNEDPEIPLLHPNGSLAILVDVTNKFLEKYKNADYSGIIEFKDSPTSNKVHRKDFSINVGMYRKVLRFDNDEQSTYSKIRHFLEIQ